MDRNKIIDEFLVKGLEYLKSAEAFAQENVPAYLEEILKFQAYKEGVSCLWSLPPLILAIFLGYMTFFKKYGEDSEPLIDVHDDVVMWGGMGTILFSCLTLNVFITNALDVVQIHVAPRMYLIEYFKDL